MDEQHARELSKAAAQHAQRGMLSSSNACLAAVDQTRLELRRRAELMLRHLLRASAVFQATEVEGLADSAMELLGEVLQQQADHLWAFATESPLMGLLRTYGGAGLEQLRAQYDAARERERGRLELELEHWEAELKRRHGGGGLPPTTVSIAGNHNVVQAGIVGSTASIIIDADSIEAVKEALAAVRSALSSAGDLSSSTIRELTEIITDCETEVNKPEPNRMRLTSVLQGLATTVQTTASLQGAWDVVRRALQQMGFLI